MKLTYKQKRKVNKAITKIIDNTEEFINKIICHPLNVLEKRAKKRNNHNKPIYESLLIPDVCFIKKSKKSSIKSLEVLK